MAGRRAGRRDPGLRAVAVAGLARLLPHVGRLRRGAMSDRTSSREAQVEGSTDGRVVVAVGGVGKRFRRYRERPTTLKERFVRFRTAADEFWALRDVTADVHAGETLGL